MLLTITIITSLLSFILSFFVYLKNAKSATNVYFSTLFLLLGSYSIFNFLSLHSSSNDQAFFWAKFILYVSIPVGPLFYFFVKTFPGKKFVFNLKIQMFFLLWSLVNIFLANSGLIFKSVILYQGNPQIQPGSAVFSFGILQIIAILTASWTLAKKYKSAKGLFKNQLRYITFGIIVSIGLTLIATLILPLVFHNSILIPISPILLLIAGIAISYAIIRHRLLDIRLILARSATFVLIIFLLVGIYIFYFVFVGSLVFNVPFSIQQFLFYGFILLITAFIFPVLRNYFEIVTDKFFFKGYYDSQKLLQSLSHIMSSTIDLELLTNNILDIVVTEIRITRGAFILLKKKDHAAIEYVESKGYDLYLPRFNNDAIKLFLENLNIVLFDDLEEGKLKETMRNLNVSVMLPLIVNDEKIGVVVFDNKASGDIYSQQDINILQILAPELSIAVQNAREYNEIKRFNITLREEIDKATKDLQNANERLKGLDKLKDEFVSLASHELRTPMTVIKSYIWMVLQKDLGPLTEKQKDYLGKVYKSSERLINLVNDMLNVSRIESGRMAINQQPTDLLKLTTDIITELLPTAQAQHILLSITPPSINLPHVFIDPDKIKQVFLNLIGNSLKFTPPDGKITISFSVSENMVFTSITDNGKGILAEDMPKLFKKFDMIESNYTGVSTNQGTGLGLYITKSIIELHGGTITVKSDGENKGTTFIFSLKTI